MYCKNCKSSVKAINYWYLFDNLQFQNRIAIIGECKKCQHPVVLLSEQRKIDGKIFNDLQVGKKALHIIDLIINQIDYSYNDIKEENAPCGWTFGKAIKNKKGYKIVRSDFRGNFEVIGFIPNGKNKIMSIEEYKKMEEENEQINS